MNDGYSLETSSVQHLNHVKRRLRKDYLFHRRDLIYNAEELGKIALEIENLDRIIRSKSKEES